MQGVCHLYVSSVEMIEDLTFKVQPVQSLRPKAIVEGNPNYQSSLEKQCG